MPRRDRLSGPYQRYVPDLLAGYPLLLEPELAQHATDVERGVRALNGTGGEAPAAVSRFLLRSEAITSSQIEGLTPSPKQVALAELGHHEPVRGISAQAALVANNLTVVREATTRLVDVDRVTVDDIVELHRALLPEQQRLHGLRERQNWIGGSSRCRESMIYGKTGSAGSPHREVDRSRVVAQIHVLQGTGRFTGGH